MSASSEKDDFPIFRNSDLREQKLIHPFIASILAPYRSTLVASSDLRLPNHFAPA